MEGLMNMIPLERIEKAILSIRGEKVMLDSDLADLYGVETKALNRAVKRNQNRFPPDFMFQLTAEESASLRCQSGTSSSEHGGRRYLPYAFTEHGALMLANVLNNERAAQTSVQIVRAFVRLRQMLASNSELARKLDLLEKKYDRQFKVVFDTIRRLMSPPEPKRREIGFHVKPDDAKARTVTSRLDAARRSDDI
jgi:phage regulator Rha-like protein